MWPFPMESAHPLVVHFPIALLLTATALDLFALALRRPGLHRIALWNLALGVLGAAVAVATGLRAEAVAKHSFEIWQVMALHKRLGISTLILGLAALGWRALWRERCTGWRRVVGGALMAALLCTLMWGAHLGGRLVYEFGVGGRFGR